MKVSELIELLEEQDPDAEVLVMMQENWPFECALAGVTTFLMEKKPADAPWRPGPAKFTLLTLRSPSGLTFSDGPWTFSTPKK